MFKTEEKFIAEGYDFVVGIDEAGRGPLAGPVVAAAVALRGEPSPAPSTGHPLPSTGEGDKDYFNLIRDSKLLSEKQRESLYDFIMENFYVGVGICDHETIDRINILEATYLSMKMAVSDLLRALPHPPRVRGTLSRVQERGNKEKCLLLVDGNKLIPNFSMEQRAIVGGDRLVKSISAASIVAKVTRDRMMREYHEKYPQYNFLKHKGYGTKLHMECLAQFGPCEIHRRSFGPVKRTVR